MVPKLQIHT